MNAHTAYRFWKANTTFGILLILFLFLMVVRIPLGKSYQEESSGTQEREKKIAIGVPSHIPLKIKIKNLNSKKWAHDLEVEVTNTSDKPIYFLGFYLTLPGIKGLLGSTVGFWLVYGRSELLDFSSPVQSDDVPIKLGEKYTFKIPEGSAKGWDYLREKEGRPEPNNIKLVFQELNFGDGTGYVDTSGSAVDIHKKAKLNSTRVPPRPVRSSRGSDFIISALPGREAALQ